MILFQLRRIINEMKNRKGHVAVVQIKGKPYLCSVNKTRQPVIVDLLVKLDE